MVFSVVTFCEINNVSGGRPRAVAAPRLLERGGLRRGAARNAKGATRAPSLIRILVELTGIEPVTS